MILFQNLEGDNTKKGFTLIELLAVIVILAIIAVIAVPIVLNIIKDSKTSSLVSSSELYISAIKNASVQKKYEVPKYKINDGVYYITKNGGLCVGTYESNKCTGDVLEVDVSGEVPNSGTITFENEVVTNVNLVYLDGTIIMNSKGELVLAATCKLIEGKENTIGSKYQCKVKDKMEKGFENGYYFYVLSHNEDGSTNLIMERNIYYDSNDKVGKVATAENTGLVAWSIQTLPNNNGPVTALGYLHDATKDWEYVPNIVIDYEDENININTGVKGTTGYGVIKTLGNTTKVTTKTGEDSVRIENLKARMPKYSEVHAEGMCLTSAESGGQFGSCPLWLVNYLAATEYYTKANGKVEIEGIFGYWTLASISGTANYGWRVRFPGYLLHDDVRYGDSSSLRPVITLYL